jgi:hypothetical protein
VVVWPGFAKVAYLALIRPGLEETLIPASIMSCRSTSKGPFQLVEVQKKICSKRKQENLCDKLIGTLKQKDARISR